MSPHNKNIIIGVLVISVFSIIIHAPVEAKSVYAVPDHWGAEEALLNVYDVMEATKEGHIEYRATYDLAHGGAGDVAIDTHSNILFLTFEFQDELQLVNAKTFLSEGTVTADGLPASTPGLAGLILEYIDPNTTYLYTVERGTNKLFAYDWDAEAKELTLLPFSPSQNWYTLLPQDPESDPDVTAWGLCFDPFSDRLYVSQYSNIVYAYDPNISASDPDDRFRCIRKIDLGSGNTAMDIDVDSANGWLYAGGYASHQNLIRFDLNEDDPCDPDYEGYIQPIGAGVIGLSVSLGTNMVYMTTYNHKLEAWDTDTWAQIDTEDIGAGAGVCVAEEGYVPPFEPNKTDNIEDCVAPRDGQITYTINYDYQWNEEGDPDPADFDSVIIVDELSQGVDFLAESSDPCWIYNEEGHYVTFVVSDPNLWYETEDINLVVQVNRKVPPNGKIENTVKVKAYLNNQEHIGSYKIETDVCDCTGYGKIIYVDASINAPDPNGSSWGTAFRNLIDAIATATICDEIWVADGIYKLTTYPYDTDATFPMVNGVGVYGGFLGGVDGETERYERNWFSNETVLNGTIDSFDNEPNCVDYVVVSDANAPVSALDGFTIIGGGIAGVYCEKSSPTIQHNKITDNAVGIYCFQSEQPVIKNNWIYKNENGIYLDNPEDAAVVRNNTIADNANVGVYQHAGTYADISNCIIWGNEGGQLDLDDRYMPTYSCIQGSSEVNPYHNINTNPDFACTDPNLGDYRLDPCSPCIDAGDPAGDYTGERDIDKHFRVLDGNDDDEKRVDMGADEYCNQGTDNVADFNEDDIVDTSDLVELAAAWLIDNNDPCWAIKYYEYDLYDDDVIDYIDFAYFASQWHWMTCEMMQGYAMMEMMMGMGKMMGDESMLISEPAAEKKVSETQPEPSVEEQIEQIKEILDWLYEIRDEVDVETWLSLTTTLEEMLKELEDSQQG